MFGNGFKNLFKTFGNVLKKIESEIPYVNVLTCMFRIGMLCGATLQMIQKRSAESSGKKHIKDDVRSTQNERKGD